jgi:hypothetical protein
VADNADYIWAEMSRGRWYIPFDEVTGEKQQALQRHPGYELVDARGARRFKAYIKIPAEG